VKVIVGWVLALLCTIGAGAGVEAAVGVTPPRASAAHEPSLLLRQLWNRSERLAVADGDPAAIRREGVGPVSRERAERVISGAGVGSTMPVYVIEIAGQFVCPFCTGPGAPRKPPKPQPAVISLTLATATLRATDFGFMPRWISLQPLGTPFALPAPPPPARYWPVATRLP
jgi:hypothetical protein